jgi:hypothetical protein
MGIAFPILEFQCGSDKGLCLGGSPGTGAVPGGEWAAPVVSPLADMKSVCSTWRASLSLGPLQPVGLMVGGGRVPPPGCLGAEGFARYVCCGRLPSHISKRRVGSLVLVVTRCLRVADEARKRSIYIRTLVVATWRGGGQGVYDVSADVRTRWGLVSVGTREIRCEHRWPRKDEVNSLWECSVEELRIDGLDVHRESGVSVLNGLRWEEMWELVSQIRDATRGSRVRVRVCADLGVIVNSVASSK